MVAGIEKLGIEQCSQGVQWENEFREQLERRSVEQKTSHQRDRQLEENQKLQQQVRISKKEVDRLQRDNNLLASENELLRSQVKEREQSDETLIPIAQNEASENSLRYASFMLPKFNGTDPTEYGCTWIKVILRCQGIFNWTEAETLLAARVSLEGSARQWLTAQRRDVTTWKDFKEVFEDHYNKEETSSSMIHLTLAQKRWNKNEDVRVYIEDVEEMSSKINLDEKYIMAYLIHGFTDEKLIKDGLKELDTLEKVKDAMVQYGEIKFLDDVKETPTKPTDKTCYNCKEIGHLYTTCQKYSEGGFIKIMILVFVVLLFIGI